MTYKQSDIFLMYVLSVFYIYIARVIFPTALLNFADDIIFALMVFNILFLIRNKKIHLDVLLLGMCGFIVLYFIYGVLNGNGVMAPLMYLRHFKNLFFVIIIASVDKNLFDKVMRLVLYALVLSVPIAFYQFKTADMSNTAWWDEVGGILGRDGHSGTLSLLILTYILYEYFTRLRDGRRIVGAYLFLVLPMLINETKIVIAMIPVVFLIVSLAYSKKSSGKMLLSFPFFVIGAYFINSAYSAYFDVNLSNVLSFDFIYDYFFIDEAYLVQEIDIGRFTRLIYAHEYLVNHGILVTLFGEGLGATFYGQNSGVEGKVVSEFFLLRLHTGSRIQLYNMLLEFGYVGTASFILFFVWIWYSTVFSKTRTNEETLVLVIIPVFIFGLFYQAIIESKVIMFLMCYSIAASRCNKRFA